MKFHFLIPICALLGFAPAHAQQEGSPRKGARVQPGVRPLYAGKPIPERVAPTPANAQTAADAPSRMAAAFFAQLIQGEIDAAYTGLTRDSKIAERPEELKQLKTKTKEAIEVFGDISGFDLVETKPIGTRLVRTIYISLGKVFPLRWRFYFYKPEDTWRLIDLRVDDKLSGIFEEPDEPRVPDLKP